MEIGRSFDSSPNTSEFATRYDNKDNIDLEREVSFNRMLLSAKYEWYKLQDHPCIM